MVQPRDTNNFSLANFKFKLGATPNVEYRLQSLTLPGMTLGTVEIPTGFVKLKEAGEIMYEDLQLTILAGEHLTDYLEVVRWMERLGHPHTLEEYDGTKYDASILLLDSKFNTMLEAKFLDVFPTNVSALSLDTSLSDTEYATFSLSMSFSQMFYKTVD